MYILQQSAAPTTAPAHGTLKLLWKGTLYGFTLVLTNMRVFNPTLWMQSITRWEYCIGIHLCLCAPHSPTIFLVLLNVHLWYVLELSHLVTLTLWPLGNFLHIAVAKMPPPSCWGHILGLQTRLSKVKYYILFLYNPC